MTVDTPASQRSSTGTEEFGLKSEPPLRQGAGADGHLERLLVHLLPYDLYKASISLNTMSVVEELRRNDPEKTAIRIVLFEESSAADLAEALEQNPFVTEIRLNFILVQTTDWEALLRVIVTRENLGKVTLIDAYFAEHRNAPPVLVRAFLRSIQQNHSIRAVDLEYFRLPSDVSTFVDTASAITFLSLEKCDFAPTEREHGIRDLAAALQRNTNIKHLTLGIDLEENCYAIPILQALQSNDALRNLEILGTFSDATSHAMHQLLESTTCITQFHLSYADICGETLRRVAQSLIRSAWVSALKFEQCLFRNEESTAIFRSIFQEKRNSTSLSLGRCILSGGISGQVHDVIIFTLSQPDSALRTLEFEWFASSAGYTDGHLLNLFRAVEKSKLECFKVGRFDSNENLQVLTQSIPLMHIKELTIEFSDLIIEENAKREVLQAVKNNFSLRSVESRHEQRDLFNDDDKLRLVFYADRNEHLDQWVDSPQAVDQKVWPDALKLADRAGPDSLFRGLRSVFESDCVKSHAGRKRKRPQFYIPS